MQFLERSINIRPESMPAAASPHMLELWRRVCLRLLWRILSYVVYWHVPYWPALSLGTDSD